METEKNVTDVTDVTDVADVADVARVEKIATVADAELEERLAAAREEGRIAGRNELLAEQLRAPSLWEIATDDSAGAPADDDTEILKTIRPCVWD